MKGDSEYKIKLLILSCSLRFWFGGGSRDDDLRASTEFLLLSACRARRGKSGNGNKSARLFRRSGLHGASLSVCQSGGRGKRRRPFGKRLYRCVFQGRLIGKAGKITRSFLLKDCENMLKLTQ